MLCALKVFKAMLSKLLKIMLCLGDALGFILAHAVLEIVLRIAHILKLVLLFLSLLGGHTVAQEQTLHWIISDMAPRNIFEGPFKGQGINDVYLDKIEQHLPTYRHQEIVRSLSRAQHDVQYQNSCSLGFNLTKERKEKYVFSIPYSVAPQPLLVANDEGQKIVASYLDADGSVSFADILKDQQAHFIQSEGRSFSESMNTMIRQYLDSDRILHVNTTNAVKQIMFLLERRRGNVSIIDARHYSCLRTQFPHADFQTYPMNDIDEHFHAYIVCTKNAWGEAIIKDINDVIEKLRHTRDFHKGALLWMPENHREAYWQFIESHIEDDHSKLMQP